MPPGPLGNLQHDLPAIHTGLVGSAAAPAPSWIAAPAARVPTSAPRIAAAVPAAPREAGVLAALLFTLEIDGVHNHVGFFRRVERLIEPALAAAVHAVGKNH